MNRRFLPLLALAAGLLSTLPATAGPSELRIDLAASQPGSAQDLSVDPGTYQVVIVNKVPTEPYDIKAEESFTPVAVLPKPGETGIQGKKIVPGCEDLQAAIDALPKSKTEVEVSQTVAQIEKLLGDPQTTCKSLPVQDDARRALESTRETLPNTYSIQQGQQLAVTVSRGKGADTKTWKVTYRGPERGHWVTSYGFTFPRNEDQLYFAKAAGTQPSSTQPPTGTSTPSQFTITRKKDHTGFGFAPSFFFSWLPAKRQGSDWSLGPAAGRGFDQSNPVVFLGPMLTYNQDVNLVVGVVMHKQKRMNGQYSPYQIVT